MNYMNYYNLCEINAMQGLDSLKAYLQTAKDLLWTESEWNGITTIEVEYFIDNECTLTDMCGIWEFDSRGRFIE